MIKKDSLKKERMLAFQCSKEFTEEDLKSISGAANKTGGVSKTNSPTFNPQTGQSSQDSYADSSLDF